MASSHHQQREEEVADDGLDASEVGGEVGDLSDRREEDGVQARAERAEGVRQARAEDGVAAGGEGEEDQRVEEQQMLRAVEREPR